ncbi:DUF803-domain-containing protein [Trichodelitschia bisporula]|uniref:DUF803-domain-containing protein n=1 Tax=Trichodelitschia bisporula TaxID=703511 RepID=A0A6G1I8T2_9PEZI|nr:DUF803-domain-containing protein [Trichodelitschia bisporula]
MRVPVNSNAAAGPSFFAQTLIFVGNLIPDRNDTARWDSLIGITTAICGNILISIALNTQRYAHIKLNQQLEEEQRNLKRARRRVASDGQGTRNVDRHKERRRDEPHARNGHAFGEGDGEEEAGESEPLLASRDSEDYGEPDSPVRDVEAQPEVLRRKSYLKSPYWWAGIILMTVGEAGNFLAYGFAPASIVSPLGVVALISNCVIAPFFLKEKFRKRDFFGVLVSVAGAVTVVLSAKDSNPKLGPDEIWDLIARWEFETYLGITVAVIIALMFASTNYGRKSIFIDLGLVGLFGGYTALSTKGVASMLSYTLFRALTFPITYLLILVLLFTAVMQIKYINRALKRFDATQVIPTQFVMFTLSVILGSAILYRDFERESSGDAGKFIGGCAMTFLGVYFITSGRHSDPEEEDEPYDVEGDEAIGLVRGSLDRDAENAPDSGHRTSLGNGEQSAARVHDSYRDDDESTISPPESPTFHAAQPPRVSPMSVPEEDPFDDPHTPSEPVSATPSSLVNNPWIEPEDYTSRARQTLSSMLQPLTKTLPSAEHEPLPNTLSKTNSTPTLPTERPSTPPNRASLDLTNTPHNIHEHPNFSHQSIAAIFTGPLTSPLSSPLTAVVADSLRRGVDIATFKPRRSRARGHAAPHTAGSRLRPRGNSESTVTTPPRGSENTAPAVEASRRRSLSVTFNDLFRRKGKKPDQRPPGAGEPAEEGAGEAA